MDLPNLHRRDMDRPHTASNCQKFEVRGESLMASRSFKYFGQGQGVSAYTFVDERHFLWHSLMISAADRESAYVIDGLMCNDVVRSDIHSTEPHGCNEVVFGLTHLMSFSLAPRIKGVGKQTLYIFRRLPESTRTWVTFRAICHDSIDVQHTRCILLSTTIQIYNQGNMELGTIPEFYIGSPVESVDLRFRDEFVAELWQTLRTGHVVLTAPRRTGKTSVMDYLRDHPENEFQVVSINVQDLTHPADFFQVLLDAFHDAHPDFLRDRLAAGWGLVSGVFDKVESIGAGDFKLALRGSDPDWHKNWRQHGDTFLTQARATGVPILFIIDEFPDMLLNLSREDEGLLREFLAWLRTQRQKPSPKRDSIRWLVGGSVNLTGTLDALGMVDLINDLEDASLPMLTDENIQTFVADMLSGRNVQFDIEVPRRLVARLGRPIPYFMQIATQSLHRQWKREQRRIVPTDVDAVFDEMIVGSAARTQLQHYHSRIRQFYAESRRSIAHALLGQISVSESGLPRATLLQETDRALADLGTGLPEHERRQLFNRLMFDLENDFYIVEVKGGHYDFASGVLKSWWRKYYA